MVPKPEKAVVVPEYVELANSKDELQNVEVQSTAFKPDKNVVVPDYDLLTEGYDPAKLKRRSP